MTHRIIGVLLIVAGIALGIGSIYLYGHAAGRDACKADQAQQQAIIQAAVDAANATSAAAIRDIKVVNRTIQQRVEREIQTNTVFRDCRLPDGVRDDINAAIAGRPNASASGVLPSPDAAAR